MNYLQVVLFVLLTLFLSACGGGGSSALTDSPAAIPPIIQPPVTPPTTPPTTPPPTASEPISLRVAAGGTEQPVEIIPGDYLALNEVEVVCRDTCPSNALFKGIQLRAAVTPNYLAKPSSLAIKSWRITLAGKPVEGYFHALSDGSFEFIATGDGVPLSPGTIEIKVETDVKMGYHGFTEEVSMAILTSGAASTIYLDGIHGKNLQFRSLGTAIAVNSSASTFPATPHGGEIGHIDMVCPIERVSCISGVFDFDLTGMKTGDTFSVSIGDWNLADIKVTNEMKATPYRIFLPAIEFAGGLTHRVSFKNNTFDAGGTTPTISGRLKVLRFEVGTGSGNSLFFQTVDCATDPILARSCVN